ncbi:LolA family protein [Streptomyces phytophilus]|uniref:LolA family protein n=1 Tax=Streptomyces phytophilus TaxID=722715 RepID=UPI0015F04317|nr:outer membrane lipoprotein carrier protein LolA [Streptomyces phytophilus]
MALIPPERPADEAEDRAADLAAARRRKAVRYGVPLGIAGLAAATIGLVPALAQDDGPSADDVTAKELIAKALASDVESVDGTVKVSTDLGLPSLPFGGGGGGADLSQLLAGDTKLHVAADGPEKQRVTLTGSDGDRTVVHNGKDVWTFGGGSDEVSHSTVPEDGGKDSAKHDGFALPKDLADATPQELADKLLKAADDTTDVTVAGTAQVAGQDAYELRLTPKQDESTVRDITVAVDADNGVPLRVALTADDGKAVVDVGFTKVDFNKPDADLFAPPAGAEVTERDLGEDFGGDFGKGFGGDFGKGLGGDWAGGEDWAGGDRAEGGKSAGLEDVEVHGEGWGSIAELPLPGGALGEDGVGAALDFFTDKTDAGRVFESRLVNVLITDDAVYVGAVTPEALQAAAD